jgi:hypothetical protein
MKLTRPIVGIMMALLISQFALNVGLWIVSYLVSNDSSSSIHKVIDIAELGAWLLTIILVLSVAAVLGNIEAEAKESARRHGGMVRALFSRGYWNERWELTAPYAPRWLAWVSLMVLIFMGLFAVVQLCLVLTGNVHRPYGFGSSIRRSTLGLFVLAGWTLPILYSKWRELSQPTPTASPEVRPS